MNILSEFNRLYELYGSVPANTDAICEDIAGRRGQNLEAVKDYIHIFRYEENAPDFEEWYQTWIPSFDN